MEAYSWCPSDFTQYVFPFLILYPLNVVNFIHKYNNVTSLEDYSSKSLNWGWQLVSKVGFTKTFTEIRLSSVWKKDEGDIMINF